MAAAPTTIDDVTEKPTSPSEKTSVEERCAEPAALLEENEPLNTSSETITAYESSESTTSVETIEIEEKTISSKTAKNLLGNNSGIIPNYDTEVNSSFDGLIIDETNKCTPIKSHESDSVVSDLSFHTPSHSDENCTEKNLPSKLVDVLKACDIGDEIIDNVILIQSATSDTETSTDDATEYISSDGYELIKVIDVTKPGNLNPINLDQIAVLPVEIALFEDSKNVQNLRNDKSLTDQLAETVSMSAVNELDCEINFSNDNQNLIGANESTDASADRLMIDEEILLGGNDNSASQEEATSEMVGSMQLIPESVEGDITVDVALELLNTSVNDVINKYEIRDDEGAFDLVEVDKPNCSIESDLDITDLHCTTDEVLPSIDAKQAESVASMGTESTRVFDNDPSLRGVIYTSESCNSGSPISITESLHLDIENTTIIHGSYEDLDMIGPDRIDLSDVVNRMKIDQLSPLDFLRQLHDEDSLHSNSSPSPFGCSTNSGQSASRSVTPLGQSRSTTTTPDINFETSKSGQTSPILFPLNSDVTSNCSPSPNLAELNFSNIKFDKEEESDLTMNCNKNIERRRSSDDQLTTTKRILRRRKSEGHNTRDSRIVNILSEQSFFDGFIYTRTKPPGYVHDHCYPLKLERDRLFPNANGNISISALRSQGAARCVGRRFGWGINHFDEMSAEQKKRMNKQSEAWKQTACETSSQKIDNSPDEYLMLPVGSEPPALELDVSTPAQFLPENGFVRSITDGNHDNTTNKLCLVKKQQASELSVPLQSKSQILRMRQTNNGVVMDATSASRSMSTSNQRFLLTPAQANMVANLSGRPVRFKILTKDKFGAPNLLTNTTPFKSSFMNTDPKDECDGSTIDSTECEKGEGSISEVSYDGSQKVDISNALQSKDNVNTTETQSTDAPSVETPVANSQSTIRSLLESNDLGVLKSVDTSNSGQVAKKNYGHKKFEATASTIGSASIKLFKIVNEMKPIQKPPYRPRTPILSLLPAPSMTSSPVQVTCDTTSNQNEKTPPRLKLFISPPKLSLASRSPPPLTNSMRVTSSQLDNVPIPSSSPPTLSTPTTSPPRNSTSTSDIEPPSLSVVSPLHMTSLLPLLSATASSMTPIVTSSTELELLPSARATSSPNVVVMTLDSDGKSMVSSVTPSPIRRTRIPSDIQVECEPENREHLESAGGILHLPDGGLLVPVDQPDPLVDEKDLEIFRLQCELSASLEQTNRHENFLSYERWAHEATKQRLAEQEKLVKWFQHQVVEMSSIRKYKRKWKRGGIVKKKPAVTSTVTAYEQEMDEIPLSDRVNLPRSDHHDDSTLHDETHTNKFTLPSEHVSGNEVACTVCDKICPDKNCMYSHRAQKHPNWRTCTVCKQTMQSAKDLKDHMLGKCGAPSLAVVNKSPNSKNLCKTCDKVLSSVAELNRHQRNAHGIVTKVAYLCPLCDSDFGTKKLVRQHCTDYHLPQKVQWLPILKANCLRRRTRKELIDTTPVEIEEKRHEKSTIFAQRNMRDVDNGLTIEQTTVQIKSEQAGEQNTPTGLSVDYLFLQEKCEGEILDEYGGDFESPCHYCNTSFSNRTVRVGSTQCEIVMRRELQCHLCGECFKSRVSMSHHLKTHTKAAVACPMCSKRFSSKQALDKHTRFIHKKRTVDRGDEFEDSKPLTTDPTTNSGLKFECLCCQRSFSNEHCLNIHYAHYAKKKMNQCKYCATRLKSSMELRKHEMDHEQEEKPYSCQICPDKRFRTVSGLYSHRRSVHPDWSCVDFYMPEISQELAMEKYDNDNPNEQQDEIIRTPDETHFSNQEGVVPVPESPDSKARKSLVTVAKASARSSIYDKIPTEECSYCWDAFYDKAELNVHLQVHKMENEPYRCPECYQTFAWVNDRHRHRTKVHAVPLPENLEHHKKPKPSTQQENKFGHLIVKLENEWQCVTCSKLYKNRLSGHRHAVRCFKNAKARLANQKAKVRLLARKAEAASLANQEMENLDSFQNTTLQTSVVSDNVKLESSESHFLEDGEAFKSLLNRDLTTLKARFEHKPIQCSCCHRVFKNNFSLSRHVSYMVAHWCKLCGGLYKKLSLHQESKHGMQHKAIMCLQCGVVFETPSGLNEHIIEEHAKPGMVPRTELFDSLKSEVTDSFTKAMKQDHTGESPSAEQQLDLSSTLKTKSPEERKNIFVKMTGERSFHDLFDDSDFSTELFTKKVVHGSNFLLSYTDPSARTKEHVAPRVSHKNQARPKYKTGVSKKNFSPRRKSGDGNTELKVKTIEDETSPTSDVPSSDEKSSSRTKRKLRPKVKSAELVEKSDSDSDNIVFSKLERAHMDLLSKKQKDVEENDALAVESNCLSDEDEDWSVGDRAALEAALESQYSSAVREYERLLFMDTITAVDESNSDDDFSPKKVGAAIARFNEKDGATSSSSLVSPNRAKPKSPRKQQAFGDEKRKKKKMRKRKRAKFLKKGLDINEESDDLNITLIADKSDESQTTFTKKLKSAAVGNDIVHYDDLEDGLRKFKIPSKSPKKRTKSNTSVPDEDDASLPKRLKKQIVDDEKDILVKETIKKKIDPRTLSLWANMGATKAIAPSQIDVKPSVKRKPVARKSLKEPVRALKTIGSVQKFAPVLNTISKPELTHGVSSTPASSVKVIQTNDAKLPTSTSQTMRKARKSIHGQRNLDPLRLTSDQAKKVVIAQDKSNDIQSDAVSPLVKVGSEGNSIDDMPESSIGSLTPSEEGQTPSESSQTASELRTPSDAGLTPSEGGQTPSDGGRTPIETYDFDLPAKLRARKSSHGNERLFMNRRFESDRIRSDSRKNERFQDDNNCNSDLYDDIIATVGYHDDRHTDHRRDRPAIERKSEEIKKSLLHTPVRKTSVPVRKTPVLSHLPTPTISPRSSRDAFGRPLPKPHKGMIFLDHAPNKPLARDERVRSTTQALKRSHICADCHKEFHTKIALIHHVDDEHRVPQRPEPRFDTSIENPEDRPYFEPMRPKRPERFEHRNPDRFVEPPVMNPERDVNPERRAGMNPERPGDHPDRYVDRYDRFEKQRGRAAFGERSDRFPNRTRFKDEVSHTTRYDDEPRYEDAVQTEELECRFCSATFHDRSLLSRHIERQHGDDDRFADVPKYTCTDCWKDFVSERGLEFHMANKHGVSPSKRPREAYPYDYEAPPAERDVVERRPRARMGGSLRVGGPEFHCEHCNKVCSDRVSFQIHMRTHDPDRVDRLGEPDPRMNQGPPEPGHVTCKICLGHFESFSDLRRHHSLVHSDGRESLSSSMHLSTPFTCRYCGKIFRSIGALNAHKAVHRSLMH